MKNLTMRLITLPNIVILCCHAIVSGQVTFGSENNLTLNAPTAYRVFAADLDGDGDPDVLAASGGDNTISWFENVGYGIFGPRQILTSNAQTSHNVQATDVDGDGDLDVLLVSFFAAGMVQWMENLGGGVFGNPMTITVDVVSPRSIFPADINGDGLPDVLTASAGDNKVAWHENLGGAFGPQNIITTAAVGVRNVYAADLDNDGDPDAISASWHDDTVAWYENLGSGNFGPRNILSDNAAGAECVYADDLNGDGLIDILSASFADWKIAWYENLGGGMFAPEKVITTNAIGARWVHATDLDNDGDPDVLSASTQDDRIAWYENLGGGVFGSQVSISTNVDGATSVFAADLDNDGDDDVLSASRYDGKITWYENLFSPPWSFSITETPSFDLNFNFDHGQPTTQYLALYSLDPLNGSSPGTGLAAGLHISFSAVTNQLMAGMAGDPIFGGILDSSGSAAAIYNQPGIAALTGVTVWGIAIQMNPSQNSSYEASPITTLTFL